MPSGPFVLFYDGDCGICQASRDALARRKPLAPLRFINSQDDRLMADFPQVDRDQTSRGIVLLAGDDRQWFGYDAVTRVLGILPRWRWIAPLLAAIPLRWIGWPCYRWVARNRHRISGWLGLTQCKLPTR